MSETRNTSPVRDRLTQEVILLEAPEILRIARDRMLSVVGNKSRVRTSDETGDSSVGVLLDPIRLEDSSNLANGSKRVIVDEEKDYSIEKRAYVDFYEIVLTRFPFHPMSGAGIVSEGIRIRVDRTGEGGGFIEYHLKEKDKEGKPIPSQPLKNTREALRLAMAFVGSI
jgi:hypothetical protein